jgi:hypothetical protein
MIFIFFVHSGGVISSVKHLAACRLRRFGLAEVFELAQFAKPGIARKQSVADPEQDRCSASGVSM